MTVVWYVLLFLKLVDYNYLPTVYDCQIKGADTWSLINKYLANSAGRICVLHCKTHAAFSLVTATWDSRLYAIYHRWIQWMFEMNINQAGAAYDVKVKYASQVIECHYLLIQGAQLFRWTVKSNQYLVFPLLKPHRYIQITWKTIQQEEEDTTSPKKNSLDILP